MIDTCTVTRTLVSESQRLSVTAELFGMNFPLLLEPAVFTFTSRLASEYHGGYWQFYLLGNGGFYMAPDFECRFRVVCENGFEGELSADALGLTSTMYAFSHLSFLNASKFANTCADQFHLAREYMFEHSEASDILRTLD